MQPIERWRPVVGYEGLYEVSDRGRVRSLERRSARGKSSIPIRARILKPGIRDERSGYPGVTLWRDGLETYVRIHALVLEAFVGPRPDGLVTRHLNGTPADDRLVNLAYGTQAENNADEVRHGTQFWAARTACSAGHEYTKESTRLRLRNGRVTRECLECRRERWMKEKNDPERRARKAARDREYYLRRETGQCLTSESPSEARA